MRRGWLVLVLVLWWAVPAVAQDDARTDDSPAVDARVERAWGAAVAQSSIWHFVNGVLHGPGFVTAGPILNADGSASAPSYSFTNSFTGTHDTGLYLAADGVIGFTFVGQDDVAMTNTQMRLSSAYLFGWTSGAGYANSLDVILARDAANILALRNSTAAQRLNVANTYTSSTNYEAFSVDWQTTANTAIVGTRTAATGTGRTLRLYAQATNAAAGGGVIELSPSGALMISATAPTVSSAGTSPSVTGSNGTAAFRVNVGTGGSATTIVMTMPTATTGWNCHAENLTAAAANRANQRVYQQSSTTTSVTVQNQTISTGAALAFTASDIVAFMCLAY